MSEHVGAQRRERTPNRTGERNGSYGRELITPVGKIEQLRVPRDRERRLEMTYPYLYLDATYLKVNWGSHVGDLALLVAAGVNEAGYREVLAVEAFGGEKAEAYRSLLRNLLARSLSGVALVVSDDHEAIRAAVQRELPGVVWLWALPRCCLLTGCEGGSWIAPTRVAP